MKRLVLALAFGCCAVVPAGSAAAQLAPYKTSECFAFWKLKQKLDHDGVGDIVEADPKGAEGGLPPAQMERVMLYLDLEEKLRFRCPDFAPPPDRAPGKRQPAPPAVTAEPGDAGPRVRAQGDADDASDLEPAAEGPPVPLPVRRPPR